jgi:hypothetical protein
LVSLSQVVEIAKVRSRPRRKADGTVPSRAPLRVVPPTMVGFSVAPDGTDRGAFLAAVSSALENSPEVTPEVIELARWAAYWNGIDERPN